MTVARGRLLVRSVNGRLYNYFMYVHRNVRELRNHAYDL